MKVTSDKTTQLCAIPLSVVTVHIPLTLHVGLQADAAVGRVRLEHGLRLHRGQCPGGRAADLRQHTEDYVMNEGYCR